MQIFDFNQGSLEGGPEKGNFSLFSGDSGGRGGDDSHAGGHLSSHLVPQGGPGTQEEGSGEGLWGGLWEEKEVNKAGGAAWGSSSWPESGAGSR